jgi:hypothetical protein
VISRREDLFWFIGSVSASYLFLVAHSWWGISAVALFWIFSLGFDGPHWYATFSRTWLDREEWVRRAGLFLTCPLLFVLGPICVLAGECRFLGTAVWKGWFFFLALMWAHYHVVRQHYGFMVLYQVKNHDRVPFDRALDRALLAMGLWVPLFYYIRHARGAAVPPFPVQGAVMDGMEQGLWIAFAGVTAGVGLRQGYLFLRRRGFLGRSSGGFPLCTTFWTPTSGGCGGTIR